ncbi:glycosyltransferase [Rossellomorea vietnamensis]|uniref:glycosyltransferase n=1 Tax=Rossellomorea vietnamensis TaxID=218284 RepID=UPI003CEC7994
MKKIAFVAYFFFEEDGVASLRARVLSDELKKRGHDLDIITKKSFGEKAQNSKLLWSLQVFRHLMRKDYDKLFVTCGPFWHLRFILSACLIRKKKFIVDIRDPWSANLKEGFGGNQPRASEKVIKRAEFWEKIMYKYSEHIWAVTEGMKESHKEVVGSTDKFTVVYNGHDIDVDRYADVSTEKNDVLTYVCLGKFVEYGHERAERALKKLRDVNQQAGHDYIIEFIGTNEELTSPIIKNLGMEKHVRFIPRMPYQEAIMRASKADIGLGMMRNEEIEHGTKTFDYIGLGLPIFDCFTKGSLFHQFFEPYLTLTKTVEIPLETRRKFSRRNIFKSVIDVFEE